MAIPDGGLITETNQQYYAGAQGFLVTNVLGQSTFTFTFDTQLVFGNWDPTNVDYALNNFKLYASTDGITYEEITPTSPTFAALGPYTVTLPESGGSIVTLTGGPLPQNNVIVCQMKTLAGGSFGNRDAYGTTVEQNYGSYSYTTLADIVNNFIVGYVGKDKLIPDVKRTDVIFHVKRALQEFSYDTLKSVKSQELNIPPSLSVVLPQDYVNYVRMSWIDQLGVQRIIYPANNLTDNPYTMPLQDNLGVPTQDNFGENTEGTSITEERWKTANVSWLNQDFNWELYNQGLLWAGYNWGNGGYWYWGWGEQYGMDPQYAQYNGWFTLNEREGKVSFSSNLNGRLIILEYLSDGLAYDLDSRIPKLAEAALYAYLSHAILATRINQPEYIVQRLKREASAKLRNAKIRLSNVKLDEIVQVMRGKSKWIKH
jgi:hypothetical protein|tara:strand:- start:13928 stop:15211 length:1284 start_codon:yes stop_codon:yes gene_type:complete